MRPMSIETQRELVEALVRLLAFGFYDEIEGGNDGPSGYKSAALLDATHTCRAALAKARAEMGGDDNG